MNTRPRRNATCHPDKPHRAFGLCNACYGLSRYRQGREPIRVKRNTPEYVARRREARRAANPLTDKSCALCGRTYQARIGNTHRRFCTIKCTGRATAIRLKYGLAPEDYRELTSGGKCFICGRKVRKWHVDHDHKTLETWGVICARCNTHAVAGVARDADIARRLVTYIENPPARLIDGQPRMADATKIDSKPRRRFRKGALKNGTV